PRTRRGVRDPSRAGSSELGGLTRPGPPSHDTRMPNPVRGRSVRTNSRHDATDPWHVEGSAYTLPRTCVSIGAPRGFALALGATFFWSLAEPLVRLIGEMTSWHRGHSGGFVKLRVPV